MTRRPRDDTALLHETIDALRDGGLPLAPLYEIGVMKSAQALAIDRAAFHRGGSTPSHYPALLVPPNRRR